MKLLQTVIDNLSNGINFYLYFLPLLLLVCCSCHHHRYIENEKHFPNIQKGKCNEACKLKAFVGV